MSTAQDPAFAEVRKHNNFLAISIFLSISAAIAVTPWTLVIAHIWKVGFAQDSARLAWEFLKDHYSFDHEALRSRWLPIWVANFKDINGALIISTPWLTASCLGIIAILLNPYSNVPNIYGDARFATQADFRKMEKKKQVGIRGAKYMVLGEFDKQYIRLIETLSVLAFAPPGQGKTTAIVIPTILETYSASQIILDVKPELWTMTSEERYRHGPVFKLAWAESDRPEEDFYLPSWNPLSPKCMPPKTMPTNREIYLDILVNVLCPDPEGSGDKFWTSSARKALLGMIVFLVCKVEQEDYSMMPDDYWGEEPSLPMLVDWLADAKAAADKKIDEIEDPNARAMADPMREFFKELQNAAETANKDWALRCRKDPTYAKANPEPPYARIAITALGSLASMPDKTRGSVLATMEEAIGPWEKRAVKQRTRRSDFAFSDLRGMKDPVTGEWKPVSIYLVIKQEQMQAFAKITTLFIELVSNYMIANGPNSVDVMGNKLGPLDVMLVLDEFPQFPKCKNAINLPAVGRSKRVFALYIGQDEGQFKLIYSENELEVLYTNTAAKIIQGQNNSKSAERFSKFIGQYTYKEKSRSRNMASPEKPMSLFGGGGSQSENWKGRDLVPPQELMSMESDYQYVIIQDFGNRPVKARRPYWFKNEKFKPMVRSKGVEQCPPMPPAALEEIKAKMANKAKPITTYIMLAGWHDAEAVSAQLQGRPPETEAPDISLWAVRESSDGVIFGPARDIDEGEVLELVQKNNILLGDDGSRDALNKVCESLPRAIPSTRIKLVTDAYAKKVGNEKKGIYEALQSSGDLNWFQDDYSPVMIVDGLVKVWETSRSSD